MRIGRLSIQEKDAAPPIPNNFPSGATFMAFFAATRGEERRGEEMRWNERVRERATLWADCARLIGGWTATSEEGKPFKTVFLLNFPNCRCMRERVGASPI